MNLAQVPISDSHPFDFEQQQQLEMVGKNQTMPVVKQGQLPQFTKIVKKPQVAAVYGGRENGIVPVVQAIDATANYELNAKISQYQVASSKTSARQNFFNEPNTEAQLSDQEQNMIPEQETI